jgi:hypothetical protein
VHFIGSSVARTPEYVDCPCARTTPAFNDVFHSARRDFQVPRRSPTSVTRPQQRKQFSINFVQVRFHTAWVYGRRQGPSVVGVNPPRHRRPPHTPNLVRINTRVIRQLDPNTIKIARSWSVTPSSLVVATRLPILPQTTELPSDSSAVRAKRRAEERECCASLRKEG